MTNEMIAIVNNAELSEDEKAAAIVAYARANYGENFEQMQCEYEWKYKGHNVLVTQQGSFFHGYHLSAYIDGCFEYDLIENATLEDCAAHQHLWNYDDLSEEAELEEWINTLVDARLPAHIEWEAANA
jgi:hypothetical protein